MTTTSTSTSTTSTTEPTTTLAARALRVSEERDRRRGRATLFSRDPGIGVDVSLDAPERDGGVLHLVSRSGAFDEIVPLFAGGWKQTRRGLKYRDEAGTRVALRPGKRLKIAVKGRAFPLTGASPAPVVVTLRLGGRRLCFEFPEGKLNVKRGRFVAKDAAAPDGCAEEPAF